MSATPARNWASMLKEKKAPAAVPQKAVVAVPTEAPAEPAEPAEVAAPAAPTDPVAPAAPAALVVPVASEAVLEAQETYVLSPVSIGSPVEAAVAPAAAATFITVGPVSLPAALAALVRPDEFHFVAAPRAATVTPPAPITPAPVVTSSSEIHAHPQRTPPQPVYNPPVNYFVPQYSAARPYGGELGSVPRYYNAEQQQHAQPYHPTYQTPYYNNRGGYGGAAYNPYDNMYQNYYPGQGTPYMGGRLQAQPPYYPPRNYQQQQQQQ